MVGEVTYFWAGLRYIWAEFRYMWVGLEYLWVVRRLGRVRDTVYESNPLFGFIQFRELIYSKFEIPPSRILHFICRIV